MNGVRISSFSENPGLALIRAAGKLERAVLIECSKAPEPEAAWTTLLEPPWLAEFSRFFGPLLPEISQRRWLLCDPEAPLLTGPFVAFYDMERPVKALEELESLELMSKERWRIVEGSYLLRVVNHLDEDDLRFFGIPDTRWDAFWNQRHQFGDNPQMEKLASQHSDMIFCSYEGIWAAFFEDVKLLARTFFHCAENYLVFEIEEGIGFDGNWLTGCRRTCPNLPLLLDRQNRPERYAP